MKQDYCDCSVVFKLLWLAWHPPDIKYRHRRLNMLQYHLLQAARHAPFILWKHWHCLSFSSMFSTVVFVILSRMIYFLHVYFAQYMYCPLGIFFSMLCIYNQLLVRTSFHTVVVTTKAAPKLCMGQKSNPTASIANECVL